MVQCTLTFSSVCLYSGKQNQHVSSAVSDALASSSSASPVKVVSPLVTTHSAVFSPPVAPIVPPSISSGIFQMNRYMSDNSDNIRRRSAPDGSEARNVDQVDASILETFDPLGYALDNIRQTKYIERTEYNAEDTPKEGSSNLFVACTSSSLPSGNPSLQSNSSSASRDASTYVDVIATNSSISVDTVTGGARESAVLDTADSCELADGKQNMSAITVSHQTAWESGARPKTTGSAPFLPPRISISHLRDSTAQSKSSVANGRQSSTPVELVEDVDRGSAGRSTAFQVVQGLSTKQLLRSGVVTGTSAGATASVIEGASGLLTSRVSCSVQANFI